MDHCVIAVQAADLERLRTGLEKGRRDSEPLLEGAAAVGDLFLCAEGKELPARGRVIKVRTQNSCSKPDPDPQIHMFFGPESESESELRIRIRIHNTVILPFTFIQIFGERLLEKFLCLHIDSGESRLYSRYSTGSFYFPH
jgi:hypothetical protein